MASVFRSAPKITTTTTVSYTCIRTASDDVTTLGVHAQDENGVKKLFIGRHLFESVDQVANFLDEPSNFDSPVALELHVIFSADPIHKVREVLGWELEFEE